MPHSLMNLERAAEILSKSLPPLRTSVWMVKSNVQTFERWSLSGPEASLLPQLLSHERRLMEALELVLNMLEIVQRDLDSGEDDLPPAPPTLTVV